MGARTLSAVRRCGISGRVTCPTYLPRARDVVAVADRMPHAEGAVEGMLLTLLYCAFYRMKAGFLWAGLQV